MKRRQGLAAAVACGWLRFALPAWGQATARLGVLSPASASAHQPRLAVLLAALSELGYAEGRNLTIEYRFADGRFERLPELARELAEQRAQLIVAINTPAALAAARAPGATPVLFASVGDPVGIGLVRNLSRPGGKVSGTTNMARELSRKRLQLLRELLPSARRLAVLTNPTDPVSAPQEADLRAASPALGFELRFFPVPELQALRQALQAAAAWPADALLRVAEPLLSQHGALLVRALAEHRLPAMMVNAPEVREGGLMSYYSVDAEEYRALAGYVVRVLRGESPAALPVQQPTRFELVINLATARQLGITVPPALRLLADEVIE
jgi:putative ABC transport system substrate-binding protein